MSAVGCAASTLTVREPDTLDVLARRPGRVLRAGSWKKAEVRLVAGRDGPVVIKDWRRAPAGLRGVARWLFMREAGIYAVLQGMPGVPRLIGAGDRILAVEHVPGRPISAFMHGKGRGLQVGRRLEAMIGEMHRRGVYHADLHYRRNILVTDEGGVRIIDFASAVDTVRMAGIGRLLRPLLALCDHYAILKWKGGVEPECMTSRERRLFHFLDGIRLKSRSRRSSP